jgi:hypothetical protein
MPMSSSITLPSPDGTSYRHVLREPVVWPVPSAPFASRVAFAAAHVVADPFADNSPGRPAVLDWEATLGFRHFLWSYGLHLAEAMDTSQRGMGLDWSTAVELVRRSAAEARSVGARIAAGVNTDHRDEVRSADDVLHAYAEQLEAIEDAGAQAILMASRDLVRVARGPDDYEHVYHELIAQASRPVILHWLGAMFDPRLEGYWGSEDVDDATEVFLRVVRDSSSRIDGVKISLLDADHERYVRSQLPSGVRLYTGDDFNFPELIRGDGTQHSDALLGIFAAIAPAASAALRALDAGDLDEYDRVLAPTLPLSRHLFGAPTYNYKTGVAFLAWVTGRQSGFSMVGGMQSARSIVHLSRLFVLADEAGLLPDPEQSVARMSRLLEVVGVA